MAFFMLVKFTVPTLAMYPIKPPAKVSPAPVGSKTSSSGSAGAENIFPSPNNKADRKSTRLNSSHTVISYAVFCLKKKNIKTCRVAQEAAGAAAEGIATGASTLLNTLRDRERHLHELDMEIEAGSTSAITTRTNSE